MRLHHPTADHAVMSTIEISSGWSHPVGAHVVDGGVNFSVCAENATSVDLLLFDSHLMHRSTDNVSDGIRAAMVFHYCATGTVERSPGLVTDFVTVREAPNNSLTTGQ